MEQNSKKITGENELQALNNALISFNLKGFEVLHDDGRISKRGNRYCFRDEQGKCLTGWWDYSQTNHFIMGYGKALNKKPIPEQNSKHTPGEHLCACLNCSTIYVDENGNGERYNNTDGFLTLERMTNEEGEFYGCPKCKTDGYLGDNIIPFLLEENKQLKEVANDLLSATSGLVVHLEWIEDFIVEDAQTHTNAYSIATKVIEKASKHINQ